MPGKHSRLVTFFAFFLSSAALVLATADSSVWAEKLPTATTARAEIHVAQAGTPRPKTAAASAVKCPRSAAIIVSLHDDTVFDWKKKDGRKIVALASPANKFYLESLREALPGREVIWYKWPEAEFKPALEMNVGPDIALFACDRLPAAFFKRFHGFNAWVLDKKEGDGFSLRPVLKAKPKG
jgi:hypothetical protein